ncbi:YggT family protein [Tetragenococcus osmophilus]|uniref:YggT family protein n=1 Tax=Tetragenococcus osmophilus TaxID=526944 RepID=UPI00157FAB99|nr:YggT family protein [Tetragenococcus osmophilus]
MVLYRLLNLVNDIAYLYTILLVVYALLSWFPGGYDSAIGRFLRKICEPYLSLFDHLNLSLGPINFNIAFAIIVLQLAVQALTRIIVAIF